MNLPEANLAKVLTGERFGLTVRVLSEAIAALTATVAVELTLTTTDPIFNFFPVINPGLRVEPLVLFWVVVWFV